MSNSRNGASLFLVFIILLFPYCLTLGCFKCVSKNWDNPGCEDPFHNRLPHRGYHAPCWTGRKDRNGTFPSTACTKIHGVFEDGQTLMVRDCALDSGSLTTDTELVRMSHCGAFYLDGKYVRGCVQSCFHDGCNHGTSTFNQRSTIIITSLLFLHLIFLLTTVNIAGDVK